MNKVISSQILSDNTKLLLVHGDLTEAKVDAIVNAANAYLQHGGGVAGVISLRGGPLIQEESDKWIDQHGLVTHAEPAYTSAGRLPCRYIIHAVGPIWGEGDEDNKLTQAITGSLRLADRLDLASIAFPAISTGIFGFPKAQAARVILGAIRAYCDQNPDSGLGIIQVVLFDQATLDAFLSVWEETFDHFHP